MTSVLRPSRGDKRVVDEIRKRKESLRRGRLF